MAVTLSSFKELVDVTEPGSSGFSVQGGRSSRRYLVQDITSDTDLQNAITLVLGGTSVQPGNGQLSRTLPVADPVYPWMYASSISNIQGVGTSTLTNSASELEAAPFPQFALYEKYIFTIEFTPRPYAVSPDEDIHVTATTYYKDDGTTGTFNSVNEWDRFSWYTQEGIFNSITAQQGQNIFATNSGSAPNGYTFAAMPKLFLPDSVIKWTWIQVPYRYITSSKSNIVQYLGRINQLGWYDWDPGTLLYVGYQATPYTPPVQETDLWNDGIFSTEKLCDITFTFQLTDRTGTDLPTTITNKSYVVDGWNLQPWAGDRKFYYTQTEAGGVPTWFSFPIQLLFLDPDATN